MRVQTARVAAAVFVLTLLRLAVAGFQFDTVWAEDGRVFLPEAQAHGVASLVYTYGYLHAVPRLLVLVGTLLPLSIYAVFTTLAAALTICAIAAYVFSALQPRAGHWAVVPAAAMALVPAAAIESLSNVANLQWSLIPAAFVAVLTSERHVRAATVVAALAALSSPLAVFAAGGALARRGRRVSAPLVALVVGLAVQLVAIVAAPRSEQSAPPRSVHVTKDVLRAAVADVLGPARGQWRVAAAVGILVGVALLALWWRNGRPWSAAVAALSGAGLYVFASALSGPQPRYATAAALFVAVAVALIAPQLDGLTWVTAAAAVLLVAMSFPATAYRLSGPAWSDVAGHCRGGQAVVDVGPENWTKPFRVAC